MVNLKELKAHRFTPYRKEGIKFEPPDALFTDEALEAIELAFSIDESTRNTEPLKRLLFKGVDECPK